MKYVVIIILSIIVLLVLLVWLRSVWRRYRTQRKLSEQIHDTRQGYTFLIDSEFEVKDTNYYDLNPDVEKKPPYLLGNVLHCQTGTDCGRCGTGFACKSCPVRFVIKNAFQQKHNFSGVAATMQLYDAVYKAQTVDVELNGELVFVDTQPHMMIKVKTLRVKS